MTSCKLGGGRFIDFVTQVHKEFGQRSVTERGGGQKMAIFFFHLRYLIPEQGTLISVCQVKAEEPARLGLKSIRLEFNP